jgi:hypothetical protein
VFGSTCKAELSVYTLRLLPVHAGTQCNRRCCFRGGPLMRVRRAGGARRAAVTDANRLVPVVYLAKLPGGPGADREHRLGKSHEVRLEH